MSEDVFFSSTEYDITEKIGEGGMGIVYKANFQEKPVAIKIISPKVSKNPEFQKRFLREMSVVSVLNHPNIVKAIDFGVDIEQDMYFVVLEFVEGKSLEFILKKKKQLPVDLALEVTKQACEGLQHAHEHKVVHRDIKPDNILINRDGQVKITDFGLGKSQEATSNHDPRITTRGVILGCPPYMGPERFDNDIELDIRYDIYSLGFTLYHMIAGRPPFTFSNTAEMIIAHRSTPIPDIQEFAPGTPSYVMDLIMEMTAKDRSKRFDYPQKVADAIAVLK